MILLDRLLDTFVVAAGCSTTSTDVNLFDVDVIQRRALHVRRLLQRSRPVAEHRCYRLPHLQRLQLILVQVS